MIKIIQTVAKTLLKSKKGRKILGKMIVTILVVLFLIGGAIAGIGLAPAALSKMALESIWEYVTGGAGDKEAWIENASAEELIVAFENGFTFSEDMEEKLRLAPGNFEYLLRKITEAEKEAKRTRTISIQGLHEYTVVVETSYTDEEGKEQTESYEESREEYVNRSIEVSNLDIEGLHKVDWRLLYTFSLLSAIGRRGIVPEGAEGRAWLIQKSDIDQVFGRLAMSYTYAFDVVRNGRSFYGYDECQSLPHVEMISGNPDTSAGQYSFYYPRSLLSYGTSGYSTLGHTVTGGMVTGVEEIFNNEQFQLFGEGVCKFYSYRYLTTLLNELPGGNLIIDKFNWYIKQAEAGNAVMGSQVYQIDPGSYEIGNNDDFDFGDILFPPLPGGYGDVGLAAVQIALSRLDWKYSQSNRMKVGYWDCSSMIARIYHDLGVDISQYANTDALLRNAYAKKQIITESELIPGDIIFFRTNAGISNKHYKGVGHVVMYAGNGMIVHAASTKAGTVYQSLALYYGYKSTLIDYARPYLNVNSTYVPPEGAKGTTQASALKSLSGEAFAKKALEMARADYQTSGILPSITAAQFILESGYCNSRLSLEANNCFGMKRGLSGNSWPNSTWDGISVVSMPTKEQDSHGNEYTVQAYFRKYKSVEDSIADHSAYLLGARSGSKLRYAGLRDAADYRSAAMLIKAGGYATDVNYVSKLCRIIEKYHLDQYDKRP